MKIAAICQRHVVTVETTATLAEAAGLMREHHVGALVVVTPSADGPCVKGVVTDRDLVIDALARGLNVATMAIGELAQHPVASVAEDEDASRAIAVMQAAGVRRLLVADAAQRLVGVVALDDLLGACARDLAGLADVLRSGVEREAATRAALPAPASLLLRVPAMGTAGWDTGLA